MRWRRSLRLSVRALAAHRVRTMLALAGVGAGVAAVTITGAVGAGASKEIARGVAALGVNLIVVRPVQVARRAARRELAGAVTTLRMSDRDAVAALPFVTRVAPGVEAQLRVKGDRASTMARLLGTTADFPVVRGFTLQRGRFFDADDDRAARRVVVLGTRVATTLFDDDPVGRQILLRRVPFDVIGVLAPKGALADGDEDNQVLVPIATAMRRVLNTTWLSALFVTARSRDIRTMRDAESAIGALMRDRHRIVGDTPSDVEVQDATRFFTMQRKATESLGGLTAGLGAVALAVGGTGIMAMMLLSVRERTSEIGLRLAVGATPRDIAIQFLLEATLLALGGWLAGIAVGIGGAAIVGVAATWPVALPAQAMLGSLAMSLVIGLGFGAIPARRAASIPPVRALVTA